MRRYSRYVRNYDNCSIDDENIKKRIFSAHFSAHIEPGLSEVIATDRSWHCFLGYATLYFSRHGGPLHHYTIRIENSRRMFKSSPKRNWIIYHQSDETETLSILRTERSLIAAVKFAIAHIKMFGGKE